tara:strand:+ start:535 stop:654 length:120 start_codon:yes stop_codon:yes gene_type:complete
MRNELLKILKIIHLLAWFPFNPLLGCDFPLRILRRLRRR